jgi:hypothetical protein
MSEWNEDYKQDEQNEQLPANTQVIDPDLFIAERNRDLLDNLATGSPPQQFDVRSIYDSRPINATDFNLALNNFATEVPGGVWTGNVCDFTFTVPNGFVAVLKRLHHSFRPPPVVLGRADITATFLVNGVLYQQGVAIQVPGLTAAEIAAQIVSDIPIGIESDNILESFVIADQGQNIGVRIKVTAAIAAAVPVCFVHLYGQLLQKTGRPAQFEPANPSDKVFVGSAIYTPPPPTIEPATPAPVVVVQQPAQQEPAPPPRPVGRAIKPASAGSSPIYDPRTGKITGYR